MDEGVIDLRVTNPLLDPGTASAPDAPPALDGVRLNNPALGGYIDGPAVVCLRFVDRAGVLKNVDFRLEFSGSNDCLDRRVKLFLFFDLAPGV